MGACNMKRVVDGLGKANATIRNGASRNHGHKLDSYDLALLMLLANLLPDDASSIASQSELTDNLKRKFDAWLNIPLEWLREPSKAEIPRSAQTDDNLAKQFSPPKKISTTAKKKRRGSGLRGPKTKTMKAQLSHFTDWINNGHEIDERNDDKTIGARANQYWIQNEKSMEKAAKASGEKRGYKNYRSLAGAYRNKRPEPNE